MDVLVCGGRSFSDRRTIFEILDRLAGHVDISRILHSETRGAEGLAVEWADSRNVRTRQYAAPEMGSGLPALPKKRKRSSENPDLVVAFPGRARTADMIRSAKERGITVIEIMGAPQSAPPAQAVESRGVFAGGLS